ncbi:phenylalanine--tRNA ligase subunit alpha [Candidatus Falkowbacteria bacterium]|nr:phenylalanine--tRNA ligase subunit alpha [Candidatus Falkowbacteria bacterium]
MDLDIKKIKEQAIKEIEGVKNSEEWEQIKNKYFSRKSGELAKLLKDIKDVSEDLRPKFGAMANQVKDELEKALDIKMSELKYKGNGNLERDFIDVTLNVEKYKLGHLHPVTQISMELEDIFKSMGFMILDGPELESDYYNFEALNIPSWHPARDTQDTFYIDPLTSSGHDPQLLRTHTSPVQVRAMQKYGAPLRCVVPGRVFRNEATDASHEHTFYQLEGLMIDKDISISNLIAVMKELLSGIFKTEVKVRLRPGYFPFVEPGFELDIQCLICGGKGCPVCKQSGWVELLPCGLVHPNVLKYGGIDPKKYSGFAFGLGLTRLVMMKYKIDDIRLLQSGDLRFLNQF